MPNKKTLLWIVDQMSGLFSTEPTERPSLEDVNHWAMLLNTHPLANPSHHLETIRVTALALDEKQISYEKFLQEYPEIKKSLETILRQNHPSVRKFKEEIQYLIKRHFPDASI